MNYATLQMKLEEDEELSLKSDQVELTEAVRLEDESYLNLLELLVS
jgi:hypothetical protein